MITVTVFVVLTVLAIPSFNQWIANTKIRSTTESVLAGFQLARTEAVRLNRGVRMTLTADTSWSVTDFNGLGRVTNTTPITQVDVDSTVIAAAETKELRITINTGGAARACDPSHPSSDPRGC